MRFKKNPDLARKIKKHGQTYGLPLFEQEQKFLPPAWIYDGTAIKAVLLLVMEKPRSENITSRILSIMLIIRN